MSLFDTTPPEPPRASDAKRPLAERVRRLLAACSEPIAAFSAQGELIHASPTAQMRLGGATSLAALGAEGRAADARVAGRASGASAAGPLTIERIDVEAATILIAVFSSLRQAGQSATAAERGAPLRFVWQMDAEHRFTVGSDEFVALTGPATAAALGAISTPAAFASSQRVFSMSKPTTCQPAAARFFAIAPPMMPRPMIPTACPLVAAALMMSPRAHASWRARGAQ